MQQVASNAEIVERVSLIGKMTKLRKNYSAEKDRTQVKIRQIANKKAKCFMA